MPRAVQDRVKERFAMAAGVQFPQRCVWSVTRTGAVVCQVRSRLVKACADALRLRREHPGKRSYVRLHRQAEQDRRAHKCEPAPVLPNGEVEANQRAERATEAALESLNQE